MPQAAAGEVCAGKSVKIGLCQELRFAASHIIDRYKGMGQ